MSLPLDTIITGDALAVLMTPLHDDRCPPISTATCLLPPTSPIPSLSANLPPPDL